MKIRAVFVLALVAAAECVAQSPTPSKHCGYERWAVKTGQDDKASNISVTPVNVVIADLTKLHSPLPKQKGSYPPQINYRLSGESRIVTISAQLIAYRSEADTDIHLILKDAASARTMIAEIPCPCCMSNLAGKKGMAPSPWLEQVGATRDAFLAQTGYTPVEWKLGESPPPFIHCDMPVTVTGVVCFDWPHKQFGAAHNAVEIHPILKMTFN